MKVFSGIALTMFLIVTLFTVIPIEAKPDVEDPIKIAVVGPHGWIQWDGMWVGAKMAQEKINAEGGILGHPIELRAVNEHSAPSPDPSAGTSELLSALEWGADFVVGGFRSECVAPMRDAFVALARDKELKTGYAPMWFIAGASTDEIIDCGAPGGLHCGMCVRCAYDYYKYMFRVTPMCSTWLAKQIAAFLKLFIVPKLVKIYGSPVKTYIVCEDVTGTVVFGAVLAGKQWPGCDKIDKLGIKVPNPYDTPPHNNSILGTDAEMVGYARTHAETPRFEPVFSDIDAKGAHLIIHFFSALTGVDFIKTWKERETKAVVVGLNVESQMQEFWEKTDGKCEYETILSSVGTASSVVPGLTDVLWYEYKNKSGSIMSEWYGIPTPSTYPVYTFWGAYDAIIALDENIEAYGSWPIPASQLIPLFEQSERVGPLGKFKYTEYHDVYVDQDALTDTWTSGYARAQVCQWQAGRLGVVRPRDQSYSRKYKIPLWMYSLADADLNLDGKVNMTDVENVTATFGYYTTHPNWKIGYVEADVSSDGKVDIDDVVAVTTKFGESATSWPLE